MLTFFIKGSICTSQRFPNIRCSRPTFFVHFCQVLEPNLQSFTSQFSATEIATSFADGPSEINSLVTIWSTIRWSLTICPGVHLIYGYLYLLHTFWRNHISQLYIRRNISWGCFFRIFFAGFTNLFFIPGSVLGWVLGFVAEAQIPGQKSCSAPWPPSWIDVFGKSLRCLDESFGKVLEKIANGTIVEI